MYLLYDGPEGDLKEPVQNKTGKGLAFLVRECYDKRKLAYANCKGST